MTRPREDDDLQSPAQVSPERPPAKRSKKGNVACRRCHSYKTKCSGEQPCRNCLKATTPVTCTYPVKDRNIVIKQSYVEQLEAEIAMLRGNALSNSSKPKNDAPVLMETSPPSSERVTVNSTETPATVDDGRGSSPSRTVLEGLEFVDTATMETSRPLHLQHAKEDNEHVLSAYVGEAACEAFVTRVRQYLMNDESIAPPGHDLYFKSKSLLRASSTTFKKLPERGYAMLLVDVADRMVGAEYHMFLRKPFMRRLDELYESMVFTDPVWICGMFAIFALGEMYSSTTMRSDFSHADIPGTQYFIQAMELFQDLHEEPTLPYIEVVLLLSYYCHALNRRNTTYTLTGLALRLSLILGLHRDTPDQLASGLEREHRRRVWWTVYTLDRLCSLKLGHPIMIRDQDIDVKMPSTHGLTAEDKEDLPDPQQLIASATLAKIAGNILQELYCVSRPSLGSTLVQGVQKILLRLKSFAEGLPEGIRLDKIPPTGCPGRALASLHVYFNHCIILTTRPILFYVFRSRFVKHRGVDQSYTGPQTGALSPLSLALAEACTNAATASHNILRRLWINGLITILGGFDAHYLFSSALILTMTDAMTPGETYHSIVDSAWSMLKTMGKNGNLSAKGYADQLLQLKLNLDEMSGMKNVQHRRNFNGNHTAANYQTSQSVDEQSVVGHGAMRPDLDLGAYFDVANNTADVFNDPDINDFLAYVDATSVDSAGFESLTDPWKIDWERQLLSSTFM